MGARRSAGQYQSDSELPFLTQSLLGIGDVPVSIGHAGHDLRTNKPH